MPSSSDRAAELIADRIALDRVLSRLQADRPVFHSEADLQHAFARTLWQMEPEIRSRLEVPRRDRDRRRAEYLDLLCLGSAGSTAIEFKYVTQAWSGTAGVPAEAYELKSHAAWDLARLHFVRDVERLERFCDREDQNGLALLITNVPSLWSEPPEGRGRTRDHAFRIHEGRTLTGTLRWADGMYEHNTVELRGTYPLAWRPYTNAGGARGEFRCLAVFVRPESPAQGNESLVPSK